MVRKRVDYWHDGDSGRFTDGTWFRLARVNAPEKHRAGGERATRTAAGMAGQSNGYVNVRNIGRSYNRAVVEMRNGDGSINERLRRRGYR